MLRTVSRLVTLSALVVGAALVLVVYRDQTGERAARVEAERKTEQLKQVVQRLSAERRVADVIVTDQSGSAAGTKSSAPLNA